MYKKDLIELLLAEIIKHVDVNTVDQGSEFDININGKTVYPYVFIESEASQLVFANGNKNNNVHSMALYFVALHKEGDQADIIDKQRTTEEIMYDVVQYIDEDVTGVIVDDASLSALSLQEFDSDVLAGWRLDISFIVNPPLNNCTYKSKFV